MIKNILFILCLLLPTLAFADNYTLTVSCNDTTAYLSSDVITYTSGVAVGTAPEMVTTGLPACGFTQQVVTTPGTTVNVRMRGQNATGPLIGAWTALIPVVAGAVPATIPGMPTSITVTLTWHP